MITVHRHLYRRSLFVEPRCNTFIGIALQAVSVGTGVASPAGAFSSSPNYPNLNADSAAMANAQAENLPEMLAMEAAAQEGGTAPVPLTPAQQQQQQTLQSQIQSLQQQIQIASMQGGEGSSMSTPGNWGRSSATPSEPNPRLAQLQSQLATAQQQLQGITSGSTANFAGNSTADIQGKIEQQLAEGELTNAQQFDPQFIAQSLAEEKQANPQGVAAQGDLAALVQQQINNPPQSPVAQTMQDQIQEKVAAGSGLTPEEQTMLDASVNGSVTGTSGNTPDFSNALTTGFAGEQRALQNAGSGATWLASGQTPQDITYRANQQNLGNLSAEISGATPESQFSELSGAQNGPTPNTSTNYLPSYNTDAAAQGAAAGITNYGQNVQQQISQANPWTGGLSAVLSGTNTLAKAGAFG